MRGCGATLLETSPFLTGRCSVTEMFTSDSEARGGKFKGWEIS